MNKVISKLEGQLKELNNNLKAKDDRIIELSKKEGELKVKEEMISSLNLNIEKLQ
jgi:hypothetical protein